VGSVIEEAERNRGEGVGGGGGGGGSSGVNSMVVISDNTEMKIRISVGTFCFLHYPE